MTDSGVSYIAWTCPECGDTIRGGDHESCEREYEYVRVAREVVAELEGRESKPIVVARINRNEDGTLELIFRTVGP